MPHVHRHNNIVRSVRALAACGEISNMMSNDDYQLMESFPLKWRWEQDRSCIMPDELSRIRPLSPARAKAVWERSLQFVDGRSNDFRPSPDLFSSIAEVDTENRDTEEVRQWLCSRVKQEEEQIFVSWQPDTDVVTEWSIFLKFWDDFCYPASDDVSIWPVSEKWLLHYWHEEAFYFAT